MSKGWDSGMLKKLKALVGKGLSTAEMGKKLGMSKNAVVGKLNRLGWNTRAGDETEKSKPAKKEPKAATTKKTTAKAAVKKAAPVKTEKKAKTVAAPVKKTKGVKPAVEAKPKAEVKEKVVVKTASKKTKKDLALHELLIQHALQMASLKPNQCRWPIGDPDSDNFHFCGETVFSGKPYCYEHCRQAYQLTPPKKK
jgi:GcrA cell cycle regulator